MIDPVIGAVAFFGILTLVLVIGHARHDHIKKMRELQKRIGAIRKGGRDGQA